MRRLLLALVVLAAAVPVGAAAQPRRDRAPAAAHQVSVVPALQAEVLAAINDLRASKGLRQLRLNTGLSTAALGHSRAMAQYGFFGHSSYDGSEFWQRIEPVYPQLKGRSWSTGENLVWASPALSAQAAVQMWLSSPPHRKNLLSPTWREIGLGGVHAVAAPGVYQGQDVTILTAHFGVR